MAVTRHNSLIIFYVYQKVSIDKNLRIEYFMACHLHSNVINSVSFPKPTAIITEWSISNCYYYHNSVSTLSQGDDVMTIAVEIKENEKSTALISFKEEDPLFDIPDFNIEEILRNIKEWKNSTCWLVLVLLQNYGFQSFETSNDIHIIIYPRRTNDDAPFNLWKPLKCTVKANYTKWV